MGRITSESSETMMNVTGSTVVQVLSGPTRSRLRRSRIFVFSSTIWLCRNASKPLTISPTMLEHDRRRFQRLKLAKPILGLIDGQSALILDIGVGGAFVEHYGAAKVGN